MLKDNWEKTAVEKGRWDKTDSLKTHSCKECWKRDEKDRKEMNTWTSNTRDPHTFT